MSTAGLFSHGVDLFALKFYLDGVLPINHSWYHKTRGTAIPDGEDSILLRFLISTQYCGVTGGRTDKRTDGLAVAYTAFAKLYSKLALRRAVKQADRNAIANKELSIAARCNKTRAHQ